MDITPVIQMITSVGHVINNWGFYFCFILLLGGVSTVGLLLTIIGKLNQILERMK